MKRENLRIIFLLLIMGTGGLLIGLNAGHMSRGFNAALFVLGICLLSMSNTLLGLFETVWKKKK